jgi:hypothetical protein
MKVRNAVASSPGCMYTLRRYLVRVIHMAQRNGCKSSFLQEYSEFDPLFGEPSRTSTDVLRDYPQSIKKRVDVIHLVTDHYHLLPQLFKFITYKIQFWAPSLKYLTTWRKVFLEQWIDTRVVHCAHFYGILCFILVFRTANRWSKFNPIYAPTQRSS